MDAVSYHTGRVDVGGMIHDLDAFADVLCSHPGRIVWVDRPHTILITAASEGDFEAIAIAVTRAVKAGRSKGTPGNNLIVLCEPPSSEAAGTYVEVRVNGAAEGGRLSASALTDGRTDILSLIDKTPDKHEYKSRLISSLFSRILGLQYVQKEVVLRLHIGCVAIAPLPAVTKLSWPTLEEYLDSSVDRYSLGRSAIPPYRGLKKLQLKSECSITGQKGVSAILQSMESQPHVFWPTDHDQADILLLVSEHNVVEIELDFSGCAEDGSHRLQLAGGSLWRGDNLDGHGFDIVSVSPACSLDWAFRGITRHPDRDPSANQFIAKLLKGVTYANERTVAGRSVPRFSIPQQQGQAKIIQSILRRPHRFMYKDSPWCIEVTETYKWAGTSTNDVPIVETSVVAFQHEWDEYLKPLDNIDANRPWTRNESMQHILSGSGDSVEARLDDLLDFVDNLRLFLAKALGGSFH